ncbi:MAG: cysteine desulfurase [Bdellovibrionales bacterium]|nr:cysteine desulfurase [Bdellovibrionales bacterium]
MQTPVYLDNQATTPVDPRVFAAMRPLYETHFGNASSSTHRHGWYVEELVTLAREQVAELISAKPEEIIFTSGATESNNLALFGTCRAQLSRSPKQNTTVISASTEHRAVLDPLAKLKSDKCEIKLLAPNKDGLIEPEVLQAAVSPECTLVSLMLGNNEIGVINDIASLAAVCRENGSLLHCDAAQAAGKIPVDVKALGVDLLSISAHKLYGPKGIGALFVRASLPKSSIEPIMFGGGQEQGLRSGTLNSPAIVGFGEACRLAKIELEQEGKRLQLLATRLFESLSNSLGGVQLNGAQSNRLPGSLNLSFEGVESAELLGKLSPHLSLSSTSACSSGHGKGSHVLKALGLTEARQRSSIRIGIGRFNTEEDITFASEQIRSAVKELRQT